MEKITYNIIADVRDVDGSLIINRVKGNKITELRLAPVTCGREELETIITPLYHNLQSLMPNMDISLYALVKNDISGTWMTMASFYGSEDRFIKH
jgi:hypothetical protein